MCVCVVAGVRSDAAAEELVLHVLALGAVTSYPWTAGVVTAGVAVCTAFAWTGRIVHRRLASTRCPRR